MAAKLIAMCGLAAATAIGLAPAASAHEYGPVYATCEDANAAGVYNIPMGDEAYWPEGDQDADGYACEPPAN